jgi:hypothetical protein
LFRERSDEFGWQRQICKRHEIQLATIAEHTRFRTGMAAEWAVILTVLRLSPRRGGNEATPPRHASSNRR